MKIQFISMKKYKMLLGYKYRLRHFIEIKKYFSGKLIQFRIMCEYGFDIDLREGTFFDWILTEKEKKTCWLKK